MMKKIILLALVLCTTIQIYAQKTDSSDYKIGSELYMVGSYIADIVKYKPVNYDLFQVYVMIYDTIVPVLKWTGEWKDKMVV